MLFLRFEAVFMPQWSSEFRCPDFHPINGFLTIRRVSNSKCFGLKMFPGSKESILHFIVNRAQQRAGYIYAVMSKTPFA